MLERYITNQIKCSNYTLRYFIFLENTTKSLAFYLVAKIATISSKSEYTYVTGDCS